jgi:hypothetical protein
MYHHHHHQATAANNQHGVSGIAKAIDLDLHAISVENIIYTHANCWSKGDNVSTRVVLSTNQKIASDRKCFAHRVVFLSSSFC